MGSKVSLFLLIASLATSQQASPIYAHSAPENALVPVFQLARPDPTEGVQDNAVTIDPILLLEGKEIVAAPYQCDSGPEVAKQAESFDDRYLKPGTRYTVIFGGEEAGTATIKSPDPNLPVTSVELDSPVRIHGATMALAVARGMFLKKAGLRRDPTTSERARAEHIAQTIFTSRGAQPADLKRLILDQVTVVEFEAGAPEIAAAAEVERSDKLGMEYSLFFTTRLNGDTPLVVWYQHAQSETEGEGLYIVDVIDLDGDGVNELIARRELYENYRYEVYKRRADRWEQIFKTEVLGCE